MIVHRLDVTSFSYGMTWATIGDIKEIIDESYCYSDEKG